MATTGRINQDIDKDGNKLYPITVPNAVIDPDTGKTVTTIIDDKIADATSTQEAMNIELTYALEEGTEHKVSLEDCPISKGEKFWLLFNHGDSTVNADLSFNGGIYYESMQETLYHGEEAELTAEEQIFEINLICELTTNASLKITRKKYAQYNYSQLEANSTRSGLLTSTDYNSLHELEEGFAPYVEIGEILSDSTDITSGKPASSVVLSGLAFYIYGGANYPVAYREDTSGERTYYSDWDEFTADGITYRSRAYMTADGSVLDASGRLYKFNGSSFKVITDQVLSVDAVDAVLNVESISIASSARGVPVFDLTANRVFLYANSKYYSRWSSSNDKRYGISSEMYANLKDLILIAVKHVSPYDISTDEESRVIYVNTGEGYRIISGSIAKTPSYPSARLYETNTPEYYGAAADGTTDDTEAINNMLLNGLTNYVCKGKYKISTVELPNDRNIRMSGGGTFNVTEGGFTVTESNKHKEITDLTFNMTSEATSAIKTVRKPEDNGICTLKINNVGITKPVAYPTDIPTCYGIDMHGEVSALLSNISLEGCGMSVVNCVNPTITNVSIMYAGTAIYNAYETDTYGSAEPQACGMKVHNSTILGCIIGVKAVLVDYVDINDSMIDYDDYPIVFIGTEVPTINNTYISSRNAYPAIWMGKNNSNTGVFGGNGLSEEKIHHASIRNCTVLQNGVTEDNYTTNAVIHIGDCEYAFLRELNIPFTGKACIELADSYYVDIDGVVGNSAISGSKFLLSYVDGSLNDDSSSRYRNIITELPIYVRYAMTDISCRSFKSRVEGTLIIPAENTYQLVENVIPQGVDYVIACTHDGTTVGCDITGDSLTNLAFHTGEHTGPVRINYIAIGKGTYSTWS